MAVGCRSIAATSIVALADRLIEFAAAVDSRLNVDDKQSFDIDDRALKSFKNSLASCAG